MTEIQVQLGDCLPILEELEDGSVELAYVDPPFFTQKVHRLGPRDRSKEFSFGDVWSSKGAYGKGARIMFVVAISRGGCFDFADELPAGVVAIASPALSIREQLTVSMDANSQPRKDTKDFRV